MKGKWFYVIYAIASLAAYYCRELADITCRWLGIN